MILDGLWGTKRALSLANDLSQSKFTDAKSLLAGSVHEAFKLAEDECDANQSSPDSPATVAKKVTQAAVGH